MTVDAIKSAIPHREPFLLVDEIVEQSEKRIVCRKTFRGDEWWYAGHYPKFPLTPGVLLCEAAMQAGAVLLSKYTAGSPGVPVVTRMNNVQFKRMVRPGDTVTLEAEITDQLSGAYFLKGQVKVEGVVAARLEFACKLAQPHA